MTSPVRAHPTVLPADEHQLAARVRAGDVAAFEQMFHFYYDGVLAFVGGYVGDVSVAQEIVQDLFLRVWEHRRHFALRGSPKAYLYSAARNGALVRLRRGRVEEAWARELAYQGPVFAEPADYRARSHDAAVAIARAIDGLPPKCRTVFLMSRGHGLSTPEIARALDMAPRSVEQQLWRALATLKKNLAPLLALVLVLADAGATAARITPTY